MGERRTWARFGWIWLVAVVAIGTLPSNAGAKGWSIVPSPNPQLAQGNLLGVSCSSQNACMAVGTGHQSTLSERWNGARWTIASTPNPAPNASSLQSVSCTSASSCMAVGVAGSSTMAARWSGSQWTVEATPKVNGVKSAILEGVSCASASSCVAVGYTTTSSFDEFPLAERWNGTSWAIQATPSLGSSPLNKLLSVSCTSASACTAAGTTENSKSQGVPLAERWNGTGWALQATPVPTGAIFSELNAVSCSSASACTAVGDQTSSSFKGAALAERWNGSSWSVQATPSVNGVLLRAVGCGSANSCIAGGYAFAGGKQAPLAERWNGSGWSVQSISKPTGRPLGALNSVLCSSANACLAVGGSENSSGARPATLAERWNGSTWAIQSTPNPLATLSSDLFGTSCTSAGACTAVGGSANVTLAERWNGSSWGLEATPNPSGAKFSSFSAVSCSSATSCIAVGQSVTSGNAGNALGERWNGSRWAIEPVPIPSGGQNGSLNGVSCTSASACAAVGNFTTGGGAVVPLAERWNGTSWAIQSTPSLGGALLSELLAVSCSSAGACTAVGYTGNDVTSAAPLAERWDGSSWTIQTTPAPSGAQEGSQLNGVSCGSASACVAVGFFTNGSFVEAPFAEGWNGTTWSLQSTPGRGAFSLLNGVSCTSTTDCNAVGGSFNVANNESTLAEHWNGTTWTVQSSPSPNGTTSALLSVSCTSATACSAVGLASHPNNTDTTLTERFTG